ncbi:hypothetical protein FNF31_03628 [Cafeteria roenbergensis]|uniref:Amino acid transporter transmembrane domain-containing protein n=2 Tax=Cafeteria roenbergensis TaxID=33653 RepID=A0A5A8D908_CAFRO|nr:hypothetical protein FNF31_03628 [Cafeteria roenbergensis]
MASLVHGTFRPGACCAGWQWRDLEVIGAWFSLVKCFLGIGLLTMPFAFAIAGWLEGLIFVILIVVVERVSFHMILDSSRIGHYVMRPLWGKKAAARPSRRHGHPVLVQEQFSTFPELASAVGGATGFWLVMVLLSLAQLGALVSYTLFLASNVQTLFPSLSHLAAVGVVTLAVFPLVLPVKMSSLNPASVIGISSLVLSLAIFFSRCASSGSHADDPAWVRSTDLASNATHVEGMFRFLGIAVFAAEGVAQILPVRASLKAYLAEAHAKNGLPVEGRGSGWDPVDGDAAGAAPADAADTGSVESSLLADTAGAGGQGAPLSRGAGDGAGTAAGSQAASGESYADDDVGLLRCIDGDMDVRACGPAGSGGAGPAAGDGGADSSGGEGVARRRTAAGAGAANGGGGGGGGATSVQDDVDDDASVQTELNRAARSHVHRGAMADAKDAASPVARSKAEAAALARYPHHSPRWYGTKLRWAHRLAEAEETMWCMSDSVLVVAGAALVVVGVLGWQCMGPGTPAIITKALDNSPAGVVTRALLVVNILCTYPLALFPVVEVADLTGPGNVPEGRAPGAMAAGGEGGEQGADEAGDAAAESEDSDVDDTAAGPGAALTHRRGTSAAPRPTAEEVEALTGEAPPAEGVCGACFRRGGCMEGWTAWGVLFRLAAVLLASGLALLVREVSLVLSLVGWVCLGGLSFVVPPILRLQVDAVHRQAYARFTKRHPRYRFRATKDSVVVMGQTAEMDSKGRARVGVPPLSSCERNFLWVFFVVGTGLCLAGAVLSLVEHARSGGGDAVHA